MVERRLELEPEVQEIFKHIDNNKNFLLSGGAGSGKTYSLVQVIKQIFLEKPTTKIACMTYTNAAVKEIEERVNNKNLNVSTIHDFLWDNIKHFQKELKKSLVELVNDENENLFKISGLEEIEDNYFDLIEKDIQYRESLKLKVGVISHDQVLVIANRLFKDFPKLCDIIKDKYPFILIDEYQDTQRDVVEIFLIHLKQSQKKNIIGFFGDAMQSIYDDGIGDLDEYSDDVEEVKKEQNRRSPQKIISLANALRTDGIIQNPSNDMNAPNMKEDGSVKEGSVQFLYSSNTDLEVVRTYLGWDFLNAKKTKELNLTHNLIADKAKFRTLMDIYDKDQILKYRDKIKKHIKENSITDDFSEKTFGEVIHTINVAPSRGNMQTFILENNELFEYAKNYNYQKLCSIYVNKDQLLDDKKQDKEDENKKGSKRDYLIKHLFKIQNNIYLYKEKRYNEFLRTTDYIRNILTIEDKRILKQKIEELINVGNKTIEEIINEADEKGICLIDDNLNKFKEEKKYLYDRVKNVKFLEFQDLYKYLEGFTPFSTQHKTKGTEFDNVLVILDNGKWNKYSFDKMFIGSASESVLSRTKKIFYVCCTRAKENMAVFFHSPSPIVISKAEELFGNENVTNLDK